MQIELIYEHDLWGQEYDWMAIDEVGSVGFFSSGGIGPVPQICIEDECLFDDAFELIVRNEKRCNYEQLSGFDVSVSSDGDIARRGIFTFDWDSELSKYVAVCVPLEPISIEMLNGKLCEESKKIKLPCNFNKKTGMSDFIIYPENPYFNIPKIKSELLFVKQKILWKLFRL